MSARDFDEAKRELATVNGYVSGLMTVQNIGKLTNGSEDILEIVQLRATVIVAQLLLEVRDHLERS